MYVYNVQIGSLVPISYYFAFNGCLFILQGIQEEELCLEIRGHVVVFAINL